MTTALPVGRPHRGGVVERAHNAPVRQFISPRRRQIAQRPPEPEPPPWPEPGPPPQPPEPGPTPWPEPGPPPPEPGPTPVRARSATLARVRGCMPHVRCPVRRLGIGDP